MGPKHSVILSSYNRPKLIREAIGSLLAQTVNDFEVVITDDGSNQETLDAIRGIISNDRRFRLMTIEGRETVDYAAVVNRSIDRINDALPLLSGEIVHYLCDDDLYEKNRFSCFDDLFTDPRVMVGYGRLIYIYVDGKPTGETRYFDLIGDPFCKLDHNQFAHRRSTLFSVSRWEHPEPPHYFGDGQYMRALSKIWPLVGVDRVVAYKRRHPFEMLTTREASRGQRE
jgi:spore maturation protein CgeD